MAVRRRAASIRKSQRSRQWDAPSARLAGVSGTAPPAAVGPPAGQSLPTTGGSGQTSMAEAAVAPPTQAPWRPLAARPAGRRRPLQRRVRRGSAVSRHERRSKYRRTQSGPGLGRRSRPCPRRRRQRVSARCQQLLQHGLRRGRAARRHDPLAPPRSPRGGNCGSGVIRKATVVRSPIIHSPKKSVKAQAN